MKDFDYLSSAKLSPFSPTPFCNNVHKSGFSPPVESNSLNLIFYIISAHQKREIHVRKRSLEPKKPIFYRLSGDYVKSNNRRAPHFGDARFHFIVSV